MHHVVIIHQNSTYEQVRRGGGAPHRFNARKRNVSLADQLLQLFQMREDV